MTELTKLANGEEVDIWSYGTPDDGEKDFELINQKESFKFHKKYIQAVHGMIYCKSEEILWNKYKRKAHILMQMRSDGNLGFGGGLLDTGEDETLINALNREMKEEINLDFSQGQFKEEDFIISCINHNKKLICYFYALEVSEETFKLLEKNFIYAKDWSIETYGIIKVPLFVMDDKMRGFPLFLSNQFAGFAKQQLLETLKQRKILTNEELNYALQCYNNYIKKIKN